VREGKSEFVESSGMCFRSRRRHGRAGTAAGKPTARVEARATAARCGEAGRGPARGGEWRAQCWGGTWREERRRGAAGARETVGEGSGITSAGQSRGGLEVDEGGLICNLAKVQGLHCKAVLTFKTIAQMKMFPKVKVWSSIRSKTLL
jgi:hypothetical protein